MSKHKFDKRRKPRQKRRYEHKMPKANSYLIVTEGKKTEPLYFKGLQRAIEDSVGGHIHVETPFISVSGRGSSTMKLIELTEKTIKKSNIIYQNVWVLFDKDDFYDFDRAIKEGEKRGYHIGWSNQSFEYFLYLHIGYSDEPLYRKVWNSKLNEFFRENHIGNGFYHKNEKKIYEILDTYGGDKTHTGVEMAIENAERRSAQFYKKKNRRASDFNPGTTVHRLVKELRKYLKE